MRYASLAIVPTVGNSLVKLGISGSVRSAVFFLWGGSLATAELLIFYLPSLTTDVL